MENKHDKVLAIRGFLLIAGLAALAVHIRDNPDVWYPPENPGAAYEAPADATWEDHVTQAVIRKENPEPWDIRLLPGWQKADAELDPETLSRFREFEARVQQHPDSEFLPSTRAQWREVDAEVAAKALESNHKQNEMK